jgi:glycosyltransferase involved in cell wall biosynthesis
LGVQQRVLPSYRVPFFDKLAAACQGGMSLFAGQPRAQEGIVSGKLQVAGYAPAHNIHLFKGPLYLCYQQGLLEWLSGWNPDALVVEANPRYLSTPAAIRWMRARGRPVLGWGLGSPPLTGPLAGFRQRKRARFLGMFDALVAYSQRGADEYAALGFPRERIFVAYNAVAAAPEGRQRPGDRGRGAEDRGRRTEDGVTVLFVGRLQARKRVDALLRACAQLPEPWPRLVIVGDGPERGSLEQLAGQVYPSAQFVGGKHGEELKPYFAQADLFVLPGTGGLAVQEAMSHGLPVIVAKGDGTQDDLVRPGNGWQVPPGDDGALVATLRQALSDQEKLREMGAESFRIVSQEINLETMVATFVRALNAGSPGNPASG